MPPGLRFLSLGLFPHHQSRGLGQLKSKSTMSNPGSLCIWLLSGQVHRGPRRWRLASRDPSDGIPADSPSCPHFNPAGPSEPKYFLALRSPCPSPQQGFWAEPERGRKGGKKRSHVSLGREGKRKRSISSETEIVTKTQGESQRKGDTKDGGTELETQRWGERPPFSRPIILCCPDHLSLGSVPREPQA